MGKIRTTNGGADLKVKVVEKDHQADLVVFATDKEYKARGKDEVWCFVKSSPDVEIKIVKSGEDLKVCYTDKEYKAKWRKSHPWHGRLKN